MQNVLHKEFYEKHDTLTLAKQLLGCTLVHNGIEGQTSGIIVETEAYLKSDPACHAYRKKSARNAPMFEGAGVSYVYLIYGLHHCFNIVSGAEGIGEAVLIRALEPTEGIELMQERRKTKDLRNLCSGPAKLVQAMGITPHFNFLSLNSDKLYCLKPQNTDYQVITTTRIGITQGVDLPYRFYIEGNRFVSRK
ncbi:DNA-3-methyladenine glycosylase [Emticicia sp. SJ17W-69]|uniref:DNA-3-methyladenine glycosylase n=1 Tax=Emticicia sp. SJ17W-69 TaxID=3421657 RepID=UPI003EBEDEA1